MPKFSRAMEAIQAQDMRSKAAAPASSLQLGVKGKLSNQEMDLLRHQLAKAVAYDHVVSDKTHKQMKRPPQFLKTTSSGVLDQDIPVMRMSKPAKKQAATIKQHVARLNRAEPQFVPIKTKGIDRADKDRLQDEYTSRPRKLSTVPLNLMDYGGGDDDEDVKAGKRLAPAPIPQVFLL
ncbi:Aste57867_16269 [Aphanomyces stellatus]|uniref:Aste57867_16269 protein n=1 Tax=Aphanomyces stellatus TaxID=120398 RepID=A0A485L539_9STRA|nr:hypothetical protein As57867_016212 [Aphanomyces stellatus]KAF0709874.1 hypothetical protein As57867_005709 [Aphanomyces stellatus]VFT82756.1 Aste57867_5722 [Aphanomyces stellatus]VFT93045.1 Aste57867_16269 [Aphanomyces stellatus]